MEREKILENTEMVVEQIKDTPLTIATNKKTKATRLLVGKYAIKEYPTKREALQEVEELEKQKTMFLIMTATANISFEIMHAEAHGKEKKGEDNGND